MPRHIDYYFSLQSPWAYIGHRLFRDIAASHGAAVAVKPVMLLDLFAETGGLPLARRDPEPYLQRAFPAIWEQQLNLGDAEVITRLADAAGLPGRDLVAKSGSDAVAAVYEQNRQDAIAADVFGSPAYVLDGEIFWGQDRLELLADALKSGRSAYTSEP